jgi:hypothetical protein
MDTGGGVVSLATPTPDYQGPRRHSSYAVRDGEAHLGLRPSAQTVLTGF